MAIPLIVCALAAAPASASACPTQRAGAAIAPLKLLAYYPADNAWTYMWTRWRPARIDADFGRIASLGANTVRLVVAPRVTGYPQPTASFLRRLEAAISLADGHGLRVQLTLFDWWGSYDDVVGSKQWADSILGPLAGDPRVAFVELKNELDFSDPAATSWAQELLPHVRAAACGPPVTISAVGTDPAASVRGLREGLGTSQPDFYDMHYFGRAELAYLRFSEALREAAPLPLLVGEVGYSTWAGNGLVHGLPRNREAREAAQEHYLRTVQYAAVALGLPVPAPWVYSDFEPGGIPPGGPRDVGPEHQFGLHRVDGTAKPAAAAVRDAFAGRIATGFNGGFEGLVRVGAKELPALWQVRGAAHGSVRRDAAFFRSGRAALRLGTRDGQATGRLAVHVSPVAGFVETGRRYEAAAWAAGAAQTTTVGIEWYDRDAKLIGSAASAPSASPGWARLSVSAVAPPGAAFAHVVLQTRDNVGFVWLDDVTFT